jgi:hypothetical protein
MSHLRFADNGVCLDNLVDPSFEPLPKDLLVSKRLSLSQRAVVV